MNLGNQEFKINPEKKKKKPPQPKPARRRSYDWLIIIAIVLAFLVAAGTHFYLLPLNFTERTVTLGIMIAIAVVITVGGFMVYLRVGR